MRTTFLVASLAAVHPSLGAPALLGRQLGSDVVAVGAPVAAAAGAGAASVLEVGGNAAVIAIGTGTGAAIADVGAGVETALGGDGSGALIGGAASTVVNGATAALGSGAVTAVTGGAGGALASASDVGTLGAAGSSGGSDALGIVSASGSVLSGSGFASSAAGGSAGSTVGSAGNVANVASVVAGATSLLGRGLLGSILGGTSPKSCTFTCPSNDLLGGDLGSILPAVGLLECVYLSLPSLSCTYSTTSGALLLNLLACPSTAPSSCAPGPSTQTATATATYVSTVVVTSVSTATVTTTTVVPASTTKTTTTLSTTPTSSTMTSSTAAASTTLASVTSSTTTATSAPSSTPSSSSLASGFSEAYACAVDTPSRVFLDPVYYQLSGNTPFDCTSMCASEGYTLAGVEYGDECFCASSYVNNTVPAAAPASDCNMDCSGDASQTCGGPYRLQIYSSGAANADTLPAGWMQTSACAQDGPQRVYADTNMTTLSNNSPRNCIAYCASGSYTLAGVEYGDECYCGTAYKQNTMPATIAASNCSFACPGASAETCGGSYAIQLYAAT